ncbi:MAG TPA: alginate export family protein [Gammaproteobacteria bacterium]
MSNERPRDGTRGSGTAARRRRGQDGLAGSRGIVAVASLALLAAAAHAAEPALAPSGDGQAPAGDRSRVSVAYAGSHRVRFAYLDDQFRPGLAGDDRVLSLRTAFRVEAQWPRVTAVGELQDARAYLTDRQSAVSTSIVNALDLAQAYASFRVGRAEETRWRLQAGRSLLELGSGRLVAAEVYRDVPRTFTGVVAERPVGAGRVIAFAVRPVDVRPAEREALLDNEIELDEESATVRFWGAFYERPAPARRARAEVYAFGLRERDGPPHVETRDRRLVTAGWRIARAAAPGTWDFEVEAAWQRGDARASAAPQDVRDLDVRARFRHAQAGFTLRRPWSPRIAIEHERGSGDADPADGRWGRFDALFGNRRVDLAPTSIYGALGRENIDTVGVRLTLTPGSRTDAFVAYRAVRLAAAADAFASTGVRDPTGASGRDGGRQLDARFRRWLVPGVLRLDAGVTHLDAGRFLRQAPNATRQGDTTFVYADLTYAFARRPAREPATGGGRAR